jgi:hypothetical protein
MLKIATKSCYALLTILTVTFSYDVRLTDSKRVGKIRIRSLILSFLKFMEHHILKFS